MGDTLKLTGDESVTIKKSTPKLLEVEASYRPAGKAPPKHYHPEQDEKFKVLEGRLTVRTSEGERILQKGDQIEIPRGMVHQMWNAGYEPAKVRWQTRPAGRTESWFRAIDALHRQGRVRSSNQLPGPLAFGVLLSEYDDVFRLAAKPEPVVRGALRGLGSVGRLRGYSAHAEQQQK